MKATTTEYSVDEGVAVITLNRPDKLNAFTGTMGAELVACFKTADKDDAVRAVVVTGAGKAFCAGMDLSAGEKTFDHSGQGDQNQPAVSRDAGGQLAFSIFRCRKPVIAAINGAAVGVGITMTLPMDIRVAAEDAPIGFVFTRRGVLPEACSTWFLPRIVGINKAVELVYTGRVFKAIAEKDSGLFNHVVAPEMALSKALEIAREIALNTSAVSVSLSKALLWRSLTLKDPYAAHRIESKCFSWSGQHRDAFEGIRSFMEKRPPHFDMSPTIDMPDFYPWWEETEE